MAGNAAPTNTRRHWSSVAGTPTGDTGIFRSGSRSIKCTLAGSTQSVSIDFPTSQTVGYARFYVRFSDITPASTSAFWNTQLTSQSVRLQVTSASVMQATFNTGSAQNYSGTLVVDEWYGFEVQIDVRNNPNTLDWRVWRDSTGWVDQTQATLAQAGTSLGSAMTFGLVSGDTSWGNLYYDDILVGHGTTIDQDWSDTAPKSGPVLIYRPSADGTHSFSTNGDFKYENIVNFDSSATDVWSHLDTADMTTTTAYISQNAAASGGNKYCEVQFADESSALYGAPYYVMPLAALRSGGTGANEAHLRAYDGVNTLDIFGNFGATGIDISATTHFYLRPQTAFTPPSGGAWTKDNFNSLRLQFGAGDDVNAVPFYSKLAFEVAWSEIVDSYAGLRYPQAVLQAVQRASAW